MHLEKGISWVKKTDCKMLSGIPLVLVCKKTLFKRTSTPYILGRTLAFTRRNIKFPVFLES